MAIDQDCDDELDEEKDGTEMSFLDHLEELRWHIIRSIASILISSSFLTDWRKDFCTSRTQTISVRSATDRSIASSAKKCDFPDPRPPQAARYLAGFSSGR